MAACYALSSLMKTIELEFLQSNPRISLEDDAEAAKSLFEKLSSLQAFVSEIWEPSGGYVTAAIRDSELKIRDFALRAEDSIEMQLSNILQPEANKDNTRGELRRLLKQVAEDAEELLNILINSKSDDDDDDDEPLQALIPHLRDVLSSGGCIPNDDNIMIGHYHHSAVTHMKDHIPERRHVNRVIPIFGMAGIGKTCLAASLYRDPVFASSFDVQAWVTMSHDYDEQRILSDLLRSMMPLTIQAKDGITLSQLKDRIFEHLKDKRYLIVLDDVWSKHAYLSIKKCFPQNPCGSCILLTTQFHEVTRCSLTGYFFAMQLLQPDESWFLFCSKFSLKDHIGPKFEEIARRVVDLCSGLPRSIVAVAKRLSECSYTLNEWEKIEKEIESLGALYRDVEYTSKLTLIYNRLPQPAKVCFLYFAIFPKDSLIQSLRLTRLWIVEGFIKPSKCRDLEDGARYNLQLLVDSSLVLCGEIVDYMFLETCLMHSAIHSFCTREAQKEGLFVAINTQHCLGWSLDALGNACRWLSLRSHSLDFYGFFTSNIPRSFFFFNGNPEMSVPFKLLRTFDFSSSPTMLKRLPLSHLEDFVSLRYLSVPRWFEGLDYIVSRNKNLQVLIVSGVESRLGAPTLHLPSRIWESPLLRHLDLGNLYSVDPPSMVKEHLHTLSWARPTDFRGDAYREFPNLKQLKIFYTRGERSGPAVVLEDIEYLHELENLTIVASIGTSVTLLERHVFPTNLKELNLRGTNISVKVLGGIGRLPRLQVLTLENAFYGRVWEVVEGGFHSLFSLTIESKNLEQWIANATHFPSLVRLDLKQCYSLEEIPPSFKDIPSFYLVVLKQCPLSVIASANSILEEAIGRDKKFAVNIDGVVLSSK